MANTLTPEEFREKGYVLYVDMGGVLCDFKKQYVLKGGNQEDLDKPHWEINPSVISTRDYWESMPWMENGRDLIEALKPFSPVLLTAGHDDSECMLGRANWFAREIGWCNGVLGMIVCPDKSRFASSKKRILIDDYPKYCNQWVDGGGISILYKNEKGSDIVEALSKVVSVIG